MPRSRACAALLGALLLAWAHGSQAPTARAYSTPDAYIESPSSGGGGGRWFSGSPADGYGCAVCHAPSAGTPRFPLYVTGLPLTGYGLAEPRELVLSWPELSQRWRQLRPDPTVRPDPEAPTPAMGVIAELVAESGKASGTIEIRGGTAGPLEQCEVTRPNLAPRLGTRLYQVRAGVRPIQLKPDAAGTLRCEARNLGQRCIVAVGSCGAQEARIVWTPPPTQEGTIWFSAGMVATEALSGTTEDDSVFELSVPVPQAGSSSERYEHTLRGAACALSRVTPAQPVRAAHWLWPLAALALSRICGLHRRRRP